MYRDNEYVIQSIELHMFFARIMKEHSLFLKAGFTPVDASFSQEAEHFKNEFERLLSNTVMCADGIISRGTLNSGEFVTEFTATAERQTEKFTGIAINQGITARQMRLRSGEGMIVRPELYTKVGSLNRQALRLLDGLISLKERILGRVLDCRMFTVNYPLLIEHIIREARLYREFVREIETCGCLPAQTMRQTEQFWNRIMMEHSLFMRGLLDPSENELIETADGFAKDFARLLAEGRTAQNDSACGESESLNETIKLRDFKTAGVKGIEECQIRSLILPLLADHVLREANHYIRLLKCE